MLADAVEQLRKDAGDPLLTERQRMMAGLALNSLEAYVRERQSEGRRPTDPAGHSLVRPPPK